VKLVAAINGSLLKDMETEVRTISKAVTAGVKDAGRGLKGGLRKQIIAAGLGPRLARTWREKTYPRGKPSMRAATLVWSKAPQIIRTFDEGAVIRSQSGLWLAIPTQQAPKRGVGGKRINPGNFPEHRFGKLRFVFRKKGPSLLVVDGVRIHKSGRTGRRAKGGAFTKTGRMKQGMATVVMFIMVPQVRLKKRLDVKREIKRWESRLPGLIDRQMKSR